MEDDTPEGDYKWTDNDGRITTKLANKNSPKLKLIEKTSIKDIGINTDKEKNLQYRPIQDLGKSIQKLEQAISQFANNLETFTDAKSSGAISQGIVWPQKYRNYYDVSRTIDIAGPTNPEDFDSPVYNVERIFDILQRYAEIVHVVNDGTDTLFVVVSHRGVTEFSQEAEILPGEVKIYYNVYELRLRSPIAGLPYRVTEYPIIDVSQTSSIPAELANLQDEPLPVADTDWLPADITPLSFPTTFRIQTAVSIGGILSAAITKGGNTQIVIFNVVAGPALIADGIYVFELLVHEGDSINLRYSTTGGTIRILRIQEIDMAVA